VRSLYGRTLADAFGRLALKACRQRTVEKDWSRKGKRVLLVAKKCFVETCGEKLQGGRRAVWVSGS
jgi:hypothetical protein